MARKTGRLRYCLQCEALGHWTTCSLIVPAHEQRRFAPANFVTFGSERPPVGAKPPFIRQFRHAARAKLCRHWHHFRQEALTCGQ